MNTILYKLTLDPRMANSQIAKIIATIVRRILVKMKRRDEFMKGFDQINPHIIVGELPIKYFSSSLQVAVAANLSIGLIRGFHRW